MYSLALPILLRWVLCVDYYQMFWDEVHMLCANQRLTVFDTSNLDLEGTHGKAIFISPDFIFLSNAETQLVPYIGSISWWCLCFPHNSQWMNYQKQITVKIMCYEIGRRSIFHLTKARDAGGIILWSLWMEQKECDNAEYENTNLDLNLGEGSVTES